MVSDFKELGFLNDETPEQWDSKLQEKLGLSVADMKTALSKYINDKAEELSVTFVNIAPFGDYGLLIEDHEEMAKFLREEATKAENWHLESSCNNPDNASLLQFTFYCTAVDDGDIFKGHVYVSKSGAIRHVFAQVN
jgi:hypothetical protein